MDLNRLHSLNILEKIFINGVKTKDAVNLILEAKTRHLDRSFIMELVYGTVRYKLYLEWILRHFLREFTATRQQSIINLMMAVYQIIFMRVPQRAAVHEAVELEKRIKGAPSMINGVLRNYLRRKRSLALPSLSEAPAEHIAIATSHPQWLITRWIARFNDENALKLAQANNEIPPITVRVNSRATDRGAIAAVLRNKGITISSSHYSPDGIILRKAPIHSIADLIGDVFIQDEASQIISYLLDPREGESILDACAAPGGKTTHIAEITQNNAMITAVEQDKYRMQTLSANIQTMHASSVTVLQKDILQHRAEKAFDRVLLDAPCSALGVIRRNPDVKYRHSFSKIRTMGLHQIKMLNHVSRLVKRNGLLVYSVCSTEPEETIDVVKEFLNNTSDFYIINNVDDILLADAYKHALNNLITREGYFFTYPHIHNMDGFFAVRLRKK